MADFTRHAIQENLNPVFQDIAVPKMSQIVINITHFTKEIHDMDYQLHCSDDEDCKKFPYLHYARCEDNHSIDFSGSGDGSIDVSTEPPSSGSMPTPRVYIVSWTKTNSSMPPPIIHTNSIPTTASPTTASPTTTLPTTESDKPTIADTSDNNATTGDTNNATSTNINFSPIESKEHSGISILHLKFHHALIPLLLGMLYII